MARRARGISSVAGCVVVVVVVVGASQREPYETVSPFAGLYQLQEVTTSNDEYSAARLAARQARASAGVVYRKTPRGGERTRPAALLVSVVAGGGGVGLGVGLAAGGGAGLGLQLVDARIRHVSDLRHGEKVVAAE